MAMAKPPFSLEHSVDIVELDRVVSAVAVVGIEVVTATPTDDDGSAADSDNSRD